MVAPGGQARSPHWAGGKAWCSRHLGWQQEGCVGSLTQNLLSGSGLRPSPQEWPSGQLHMPELGSVSHKTGPKTSHWARGAGTPRLDRGAITRAVAWRLTGQALRMGRSGSASGVGALDRKDLERREGLSTGLLQARRVQRPTHPQGPLGEGGCDSWPSEGQSPEVRTCPASPNQEGPGSGFSHSAPWWPQLSRNQAGEGPSARILTAPGSREPPAGREDRGHLCAGRILWLL